nr:hypothetical protein [Tanacetum cinerariifolium]
MKKGQKGGEKNSNRKDPCLRLTLRSTLMPLIYTKALRKKNGDLVEMPSEAVEHDMDDYVPDEIDGGKCEQVPNHVVKKCNLEVLVCKQVANHGGDELVDKGRSPKRKKVGRNANGHKPLLSDLGLSLLCSVLGDYCRMRTVPDFHPYLSYTTLQCLSSEKMLVYGQ